LSGSGKIEPFRVYTKFLHIRESFVEVEAAMENRGNIHHAAQK
jgi:hypothetical protein